MPFTTANATGLSPAAREPLWIASLSLSFLTIVTHSWVTISYLRYRIHKEEDRSNAGQEYKAGGERMQKCVVAVVFVPYYRLATTQFMIWISLDVTNAEGCNIARTTGITAYVAAIIPVYVFFWLRQRVFYSHPLLLQTTGLTLNIASWIVLFVNIAGLAASLLSAFLPLINSKKPFLTSGPRGCVLKDQTKTWFYQPIVYGCILLILHCLIIGLFLYPLFQHYKGSWVRQGENKTLLRLIRRSAILASVCMSSDFVVMIASGVLFPADIPQVIVYAIFDVSLIVDVIAVVLSLSDWKKVLFPSNLKPVELLGLRLKPKKSYGALTDSE